MHALSRSLLNFLFPPFCLCCRLPIEMSRSTLCQRCFDELRLVDPTNRCLRCGASLEESHRCHSTSLEGVGVCFDDGPVSRSLLNASADYIAPFVVLQWDALKWPLPDLVIPTPGDWFSRGCDRWNIRQEIAAVVASTLGRKSLALTIERYRLPTPYLSLEEQGREIGNSVLRLNHQKLLVNASVLLIHDTMTTGQAIRASASALCYGGARAVWAMSVVDTSHT